MLVSLLLKIITLSTLAFAADKKDSGTTPTYMISGDAKLYTHFIERGLSMSNNNPALNAEFLFNYGSQFKVGFWGSNISNVSQTDDNFWLKFLTEIKVDFDSGSKLRFYINDDHFYKSDIRNGQEVGVHYEFSSYKVHFAWMNNFQGSHSSADYLNVRKLFDLKKSIKGGGQVGYIYQSGTGYDNYFDLKALAYYQINTNSLAEAGVTFVTNASQFGNRADPAMYFAFEFNF